MLELLASEFRPLIQDALVVAICATALLRGAGPERAMAATWLIFFELLPSIYTGLWGATFQLAKVDLFLVATDISAGVVWVLVALNANRNYPLLIAALQILVMAAHFTRGLIEVISPVAYAIMVMAPGWLQLIVLGFGLVRHLLRQRRYGPYRAWRVPMQWAGLSPASRGEG